MISIMSDDAVSIAISTGAQKYAIQKRDFHKWCRIQLSFWSSFGQKRNSNINILTRNFGMKQFFSA